jgi:hypothetical protein
MPIFIAKEYNGTVMDVVLAKSYELASAYWHGKGVIAHSTTKLDESELENHPTGVLPIVSTKELQPYGFGTKTMRVIK